MITLLLKTALAVFVVFVVYFAFKASHEEPKKVPESLMTIRVYGPSLFNVQLWTAESDKKRTMIWVRFLWFKFGFQHLF